MIYFESLQPAAFDCCPLQGVVEGRWKYIRAPRPELYDLAADPNERENLAGKEVETARWLRGQLEEMLAGMRTAASPGGSSLVDTSASKRLESLGYVGGPVRRPDFDAKSEDPKDFAPVAAKMDAAHEFNRTGRYDDAKKECLEIVALRPRLVRAYSLLGDLAARQKRPEEAMQWATKELEILIEGRGKSKPLPSAVENHEIAAIHGQLGVALLMQGKNKEAAVELRTALAQDADSADLQYNIGMVSAALGETEEAIAHYRKALELDPQHVEANYSLGTALAGGGHFDDAVAHFRKSLEVEPANVRAHCEFRRRAGRHGDAVEAEGHYRKALEIDPGDADAHDNLGLVLAGRGQVDEAMSHYRKALQIKPDYAAAHNNLGLALAARGQIRRGHRSLREGACGSSPTMPRPTTIWASPLRLGGGSSTRPSLTFRRRWRSSPTIPAPARTWSGLKRRRRAKSRRVGLASLPARSASGAGRGGSAKATWHTRQRQRWP